MEETSQALDENLIEDEFPDPGLNLASGGKRFGNMIIDIICFYALAFLIGIFLGAFGIVGYLENKLLGYAFSLSVHFIYHSSFEGLFGKTVGKMITGTHVVGERGNKITYYDAAMRSLCRFIPFEGFTFLGSVPRASTTGLQKLA